MILAPSVIQPQYSLGLYKSVVSKIRGIWAEELAILIRHTVGGEQQHSVILVCPELFNFRLTRGRNRFFPSIGRSNARRTVANKFRLVGIARYAYTLRMHTQNRRVPWLIDSGIACIT